MPAIVIRDGGVVTKDPNDERVIEVDWDSENLADSALIISSTFTVTLVRGSALTPLTFDSDAIIDSGRNTQLRLLDGANGALYRVDNRIVTNESPAQTLDRHFKVLIQQK